MSKIPDMTAAGFAIRMTFLMTVYGIREWMRLACANMSAELSSAKKRWYTTAAISILNHSANFRY